MKLPHQLILLEQEVQSSTIRKEQAKEYEAIYMVVIKYKEHAERKCQNFWRGRVSWSPEYQKARDSIEIWVLLRKKKLGLKVSSRGIQRWIERIKITNPGRLLMVEREQDLRRLESNIT